MAGQVPEEMNSIRPATGHTSLDKRAPSPVPVLLCGDPLDCLGQLVVHDSEARDALERHRARAIVIGIHIPDTDHSRKAVKYRLRNAHDTVNTHLRRHPLVRHIIYIVHPDSGQGAPDTAVRLLSATVGVHHAEIEMRHGRDVCITGIVTSVHTSPEALTERVTGRIKTTPIGGSYATTWDEIADRPLATAAAEALL